VIVENGYFVVCDGVKKTRVLPLLSIPLTFGGTAEFMVKNILPAIGAAFVSGFDAEAIREALQTFVPSPELTPGRMNLFEFGTFRLMLDYAHNEGGFSEIEKFVAQVPASYKTGIIGATGDRRDEDIRKIGQYAARIFDEIVIRHDIDGRGRTNDEMTQLLLEGIRAVSPEKLVRVISDESEAIGYAISSARPGSFIFACADHVMHSIEIVKAYQQKQLSNTTLQLQAS
jgi:cyanophycin synthetase